MGVEIRLMKIDDIPDVVRVANQSFFEWARYTVKIGPKVVEKYIKFPEWQFVAEINKKIAGFVINEVVENKIHLCWIAVSTEFQGKGIGGNLLKKLEKEAINNGIKEIFLDTPFARNFYFKYGYKETGKIFRLIKDITEGKIEKVKGVELIEFSNLKSILNIMDERNSSEFLKNYFYSVEKDGNLSVVYRENKEIRSVSVGVKNEFCPEYVEIKFLWGKALKDKLKIIKGVEYLTSTIGRRGVVLSTSDNSILKKLAKEGYSERKDPIFWSQYNLVKLISNKKFLSG